MLPILLRLGWRQSKSYIQGEDGDDDYDDDESDESEEGGF
jgi:hypothetical protein